jgi:hypothetical protein
MPTSSAGHFDLLREVQIILREQHMSKRLTLLQASY